MLSGACPAVAQSGDHAGPTSGRIIRIEGNGVKGPLKVIQAKGVTPVEGAVGMLVRRGFVLDLDPRARATVICGDGSLRQLAHGAQGCPCRRPCAPEICGINYDGSTIGSTRGSDT